MYLAKKLLTDKSAIPFATEQGQYFPSSASTALILNILAETS
jgi:hypothetical protein